ncbi:MAG: hypothetical protein AAGA21_16330 [Pseudomonadota bacterium]
MPGILSGYAQKKAPGQTGGTPLGQLLFGIETQKDPRLQRAAQIMQEQPELPALFRRRDHEGKEEAPGNPWLEALRAAAGLEVIESGSRSIPANFGGTGSSLPEMLGIPVAGPSSAVGIIDLGLKLIRAGLLDPTDVHPPKQRRRAPAKPK